MESGPPQPPYQGTLDCFEVFAPSPPDARFQNVNTSGGPMNNINQVDLEQLAPYNPLQDSSYYYFQPPHQIQQQQSQQQMQFGMSQQTPSHRILQQPPNITMQMQQHQMAVPVPHHQQHIMPSGSGHIPNIQAPQMQAPMIIGIPPQQQKRKEIYRYTAPYNLYATSWSCRPDPHLKFRLAVGSFIEEYNNKISIIQLHEEQGEFAHIGTFDHPYPATRVLWVPDQKGTYPDLLATTGDYLRLWRVGGHHGASLEVLLNNNRSSEYCAPLTSADWNEVDPSLIGTSSIDTTCTIWQIETGQAIANTQRAIEGNVKTQLIAHDKEVYDIEFSKLANGREIFASVGADGSVRMFDLRHMEYSTIVFEEPNRKPLLRLAWNKQDHNYLATFAQNSTEVFILDIRIPSMPIATLKNHTACVNGIAWAPHSSCHICTAADDCQALIWDVHQMPRPVEDPILAYAASGEINQIHWSSLLTDWISICYGKSLELLRV